MEGRREVVKAKNLAENKVHVWKVLQDTKEYLNQRGN